MNLSLIITIVLIAIVIPWLWRCLFVRSSIQEPPKLSLKFTHAGNEKHSKKLNTSFNENILGDNLALLSSQKHTTQKVLHRQRDLLNQSQYRLLKIVALPSRQFIGYELLQALQLVGFEYGPDQLFHYYADEESEDILFSVASSKSPGTFDLQSIGAFSTSSLTMFIDTNYTKHSDAVYPVMLDVAEQLACELEGEVQMQ